MTAITNWDRVLLIADYVLLALGMVVALLAVTRWLLYSRRDPLRHVVQRPNTVLLDAMLVPVAAWLLAGSITASIVSPGGSETTGPLARLAADHAAGICGALACLWVSGHCFRGGARTFLVGDGDWARAVLLGSEFALVAIAVCPLAYMGSLWVLSGLIPRYPVFEHEIVVRIRSGEMALWAVWVGTAIIAPVTEELFFRGILQSGLVNVLKRRWLAVVLSAAVFGVVHAGGPENPQPHVVLPLTVLGVLLGVLYLKTGSLVAPITLHALFNAKTLLWETLPRLNG
jgi:membrane protease YdiL (CAAX protease family)